VEHARRATEESQAARHRATLAWKRARQAGTDLRQTEVELMESHARLTMTLHKLAAVARAEGRVEDAARLDHEADMAEKAAEAARQQSQRLLARETSRTEP
jgi:hypothetical protein